MSSGRIVAAKVYLDRIDECCRGVTPLDLRYSAEFGSPSRSSGTSGSTTCCGNAPRSPPRPGSWAGASTVAQRPLRPRPCPASPFCPPALVSQGSGNGASPRTVRPAPKLSGRRKLRLRRPGLEPGHQPRLDVPMSEGAAMGPDSSQADRLRWLSRPATGAFDGPPSPDPEAPPNAVVFRRLNATCRFNFFPIVPMKGEIDEPIRRRLSAGRLGSWVVAPGCSPIPGMGSTGYLGLGRRPTPPPVHPGAA